METTFLLSKVSRGISAVACIHLDFMDLPCPREKTRGLEISKAAKAWKMVQLVLLGEGTHPGGQTSVDMGMLLAQFTLRDGIGLWWAAG